MRRIGIVNFAVIMLLVSAVGCFNDRPSAAAASQPDGSATSGSEGAQAQRSSHGGVIKASWSGTRKEDIEDPVNHVPAFTVMVPTGWKMAGTITRPPACHGAAVPADALSYTILSPDGVTAVGQLPGSLWMWQSDGGSPLGKQCSPMNLTSANGYLLNIAIPIMHPNATGIKVMEFSDKEKQLMAQVNGQQSGPMRKLVDFGRVRVNYTQYGIPMEEQLGTIVTCTETNSPAYPLLHRPAMVHRNCMTHGIYFNHAPVGHLQELLNGKLPGAVINHDWDMMIAQRMQEQFDKWKAANDATFQRNLEVGRQQTQAMLAKGQAFISQLQAEGQHAIAADRQQQAAIDHAAQQQVRQSLDRQDFIDPNTGRRIETSNQFSSNWIGSDGTVVLGDDPTFDPNGVVNPVRESFTPLVPVN